MRIADRCVNPDDRDSITKTVSNIESMLDALCELRQQGKVCPFHRRCLPSCILCFILNTSFTL